MATTLPFLKKFITRGTYAIDAAVGRALCYLMQRGAADNVAYNPSDVSPTGTISTLQAIDALQISNATGFGQDYAVVGGRTYRFRAVLPCTIDGTSGGKIDWSGGSATVSAFQATGWNYTASAVAMLKTTTLAGLTMNAAAAYTMSVVEGSFVASSSGTFGPRFATFTGTATAPIIAAGAFVTLTEVPVSETP